MKLIDILLRELPRRDGWPSTHHKAVNDCACIRFDSYQETSFRPVWSSGMVNPSYIEEVTREQYEAALAESRIDKRNDAVTKLAKIIGVHGCPCDKVKATQIYDAIKSGAIKIE
ncbi:TPA: hypothetical protein L0X66_004168 [Citrobacter freundii]|nr:hypothetical protein [Citrobacter freundii]